MTHISRRTATIAGLSAAAVVIGGIAYAGTGTTSGATGSSGHVRAGGKGLAGRALHGQFVVATKKKGDVTVDVQRGQVAAITPTSLEVRSADGFDQTYVITTATKWRQAGAATTESAVSAGERVAVIATGTGTQTAKLVRVLPAAGASGA